MTFTVQNIATGEVAIVADMAGHDDPAVWRTIDATPPGSDAAMVLAGTTFVPAPPPPPSRLDALVALLAARGILSAAEIAELPK